MIGPSRYAPFDGLTGQDVAEVRGRERPTAPDQEGPDTGTARRAGRHRTSLRAGRRTGPHELHLRHLHPGRRCAGCFALPTTPAGGDAPAQTWTTAASPRLETMTPDEREGDAGPSVGSP